MEPMKEPIPLQRLHEWHERYINMPAEGELIFDLLPRYRYDEAVIHEVEADELDDRQIEARISDLQVRIRVQDHFCGECRQVFACWPATEEQTRSQPHSIRQCQSVHLDAAARNGCRFCACMLQSLRDSEVLDLYRKIEARLDALQMDTHASLSIGGWSLPDQRLLKITMPGMRYPRQNITPIGFELSTDPRLVTLASGRL